MPTNQSTTALANNDPSHTDQTLLVTSRRIAFQTTGHPGTCLPSTSLLVSTARASCSPCLPLPTNHDTSIRADPSPTCLAWSNPRAPGRLANPACDGPSLTSPRQPMSNRRSSPTTERSSSMRLSWPRLHITRSRPDLSWPTTLAVSTRTASDRVDIPCPPHPVRGNPDRRDVPYQVSCQPRHTDHSRLTISPLNYPGQSPADKPRRPGPKRLCPTIPTMTTSRPSAPSRFTPTGRAFPTLARPCLAKPTSQPMTARLGSHRQAQPELVASCLARPGRAPPTSQALSRLSRIRSLLTGRFQGVRKDSLFHALPGNDLDSPCLAGTHRQSQIVPVSR